MKIFIEIIHFLASLFHKVKDDLAKAAVFIVKDIQPLLESETVDTILEALINTITRSDLGDVIIGDLKKYIPVFLTSEGIINTLDANSTESDVKEALGKLLEQFPKLDANKKAELWTSLAAKIYSVLHELETGEKLTFGQAVTIVEQFYEVFIESKK